MYRMIQPLGLQQSYKDQSCTLLLESESDQGRRIFLFSNEKSASAHWVLHEHFQFYLFQSKDYHHINREIFPLAHIS